MLAARLFDLATSANSTYTTIQFIPSGTDIEHHADETACDIGLSKNVYLQLFTEGHHFLDGHYGDGGLSTQTDADLLRAYHATNSVLATTNEHTTAWRLHSEIYEELLARGRAGTRENELRFCMALATSRLDRINKSPVLWHWIRKLVASHAADEHDWLWVTGQMLRSMEMHYANYCAGYSLYWYVANVVGDSAQVRGALIGQIRHRCRKALGDVSLWTLMGNTLQYFKAENTAGNGEPAPDPFAADEAARELAWLLGAQCTVLSPYLHICRVLEPADVLRQISQHRQVCPPSFGATLDKVQKCVCGE